MKTYVYNELSVSGDDLTIELNEDQIMDEYWDYWWTQITKAGHMKHSAAYEILRKCLRQACIDDFVITNYASEKQ